MKYFVHNHYCRAYSRRQYGIMIHCHQLKLVDLTDQSVSLSTSNRPLMIDIIRCENYTLLCKILHSGPQKHQQSYAQEVLARVYQYDFGNAINWNESVFSYACHAYFNDHHSILTSLMSPHIIGTQLSHIKIVSVGLEEVPVVLFHAGLKSLDLSENVLSTLPIADALKKNLCDNLEVISIASNVFDAIPDDMFCLPNLTKLNAKNNRIRALPTSMWTSPNLQELNVSTNNISTLPCPNYVHLEQGHLQPLSMAPPNQSTLLCSTRQAYFRSTLHPAESKNDFTLSLLDVSSNQLTLVPRGLPCLAPFLKNLKLTRNSITHLGHLSDYPSLLETLDVSKNRIKQCIQPSLQPPKLVCVQSQLINEHKQATCSHFSHDRLDHLVILSLTDNQLVTVVLEGHEGAGGEHDKKDFQDFRDNRRSNWLLFPKLQSLRLGNNNLKEFPRGIHKQEQLCELTVDGNTGITQIPSNLHLLHSLFMFKYEGVSDPILPQLKSCGTTAKELLFLKAQEKKLVRK